MKTKDRGRRRGTAAGRRFWKSRNLELICLILVSSWLLWIADRSAGQRTDLCFHEIQWRFIPEAFGWTGPAVDQSERSRLSEGAESSPNVSTDFRSSGLKGEDRVAGPSRDELKEVRLYRAYLGWLSSVSLVIGAFLLLHFWFRVRGFEGSAQVLPLALLLVGMGLLALYAFKDPLGNESYYRPFTLGVLMGCLVLGFTATRNGTARMLEYRYLSLLAALGLCGLLVAFGSGPRGTDARINLWFFQPMELIKVLMVVFIAGYFASKDRELTRLESLRWKFLSLPRWRDTLPVGVALLALISFFFLQKDLGPALILYLVFLGLFTMASRRFFLGLFGLAAMIAIAWTALYLDLFQTLGTRVEMWLSPWDNSRPGGIQLAESYWALASGGTSGTGAGRSDPALIPAGHTDLILAAVGETFGFWGIAVVLSAMALLFALMLRISWRAKTSHLAFLGFGFALLFGFQTALIVGATFGLLPLTGVPVPLLSYGKSALMVQFLMLGVVLAISVSGTRRPTRASVSRWALLVPAFVFATFPIGLWKAWEVMVVEADEVLRQGALTPQADGIRRFQYNRRLLKLMAQIPRGRILDRNGIPLAVERGDERETDRGAFQTLGIELPQAAASSRYYPLGRYAAHILGFHSGFWTGPETAERKYDELLRGYPYQETVVKIDGNRVVKRDLAPLVGPFRSWGAEGLWEPKGINPSRDLRLTIDVRIQKAAFDALERNLPTIGGVQRDRGAAVVLEASTGQILASVSLPSFDPNRLERESIESIYDPETRAGLDRARFEIYSPGSTFKIVAAAASLETWGDEATTVFHRCNHVGLIPWEYDHYRHVRRVTDDVLSSAHGPVDLETAVIKSCNVYFAWLATRLGSERLLEFARNRFQLEMKGIDRAEALEPNLPDNGYGQALITSSPLRMAAVAATIANGGHRVEPYLSFSETHRAGQIQLIDPLTSGRIRTWLIDAVNRGTGRRAGVEGVIVGGKTGTAQTESGDGESHAWFVGFADPGSGDPEDVLAFAFLIENGGYGGRATAQAAADFIRTCFAEQLRKEEEAE